MLWGKIRCRKKTQEKGNAQKLTCTILARTFRTVPKPVLWFSKLSDAKTLWYFQCMTLQSKQVQPFVLNPSILHETCPHSCCRIFVCFLAKTCATNPGSLLFNSQSANWNSRNASCSGENSSTLQELSGQESNQNEIPATFPLQLCGV